MSPNRKSILEQTGDRHFIPKFMGICFTLVSLPVVAAYFDKVNELGSYSAANSYVAQYLRETNEALGSLPLAHPGFYNATR